MKLTIRSSFLIVVETVAAIEKARSLGAFDSFAVPRKGGGFCEFRDNVVTLRSKLSDVQRKFIWWAGDPP